MTFATETLGQHLNFANGKTSPERTKHGKYAVFGSNGEIGRSNEKNSPAQTTVIGRVGSYCGSVHYSPEPCWVTDNAIKATAKTPEEGRFWFFALANQNLHDLRAGSGQPLINQTSLKAVELPVPGANDRQTIGALLGALDDKIELNRRMNETLEEMARALFRDWFVEFGPTRRKMEGATDPAAIMGHAFPPEKATTLAPLFPAKLGDDGLPEGWKTIPFGDALADTIGGDWGKESPDDKHNTEVAIVRGTDFGALQEGMKGKVPQRFTTGKKTERRTLNPGDILLEVSGGSPTQPTGRSLWVSQAMLDRFECDVVPASFCRRFRPKDAAWSLVLRQHLNDLYLRGGTWEYQNQSTGISNFQTTHFLEAEQVVHPSEAVLAAFHEVVGPIIQRTATNENQTLAEMRDLLLPKLMSGEIRLKDAEAVV